MTATPPPADSQTVNLDRTAFMRRLKIATYTLVIFVLSIHLLREFREMLQPLFVALFLGFLVNPIHGWLIRRGIPSLVAYGIILVLVCLGLVAFGSIMYANVAELARDKQKLQRYEDQLGTMIKKVAAQLPINRRDDAEEKKAERDMRNSVVGFVGTITDPIERRAPSEPIWRGILSPERLISPVVAAVGQLRDSLAWAALVFLFVLFLIAEKVTFPRRLELAFGDVQGDRILAVIESINQAISQYIAVKTLVSVLAGILTYAVLAFFGVELAASWALLVFLLNYIPYVGSLIACTLPIVLSFLQFPDELWKPIMVTILLIGIQQGIGNWIEPRMAGQRLDVSPLLIVLSLTFWWTVWGIFGAILAVPLLVIVRIILDNIPETKPIATLISNR
ncbi:MAG TPA: AI-2E family transporter [Gemmataceae bacterium]|nr:AI-2E family transporter [Gemmataceae bacterium]